MIPASTPVTARIFRRRLPGVMRRKRQKVSRSSAMIPMRRGHLGALGHF